MLGTLTSGLNSCAAVVSCTGSPPDQAFQDSAVEWVGASCGFRQIMVDVRGKDTFPNGVSCW